MLKKTSEDADTSDLLVHRCNDNWTSGLQVNLVRCHSFMLRGITLKQLIKRLVCSPVFEISLNVFPSTVEPTFSPGDPGSGCVSILDPNYLRLCKNKWFDHASKVVK